MKINNAKSAALTLFIPRSPLKDAVDLLKLHLDSDCFCYRIIHCISADRVTTVRIYVKGFNSYTHEIFLTEDYADFYWISGFYWEAGTPFATRLEREVAKSQLGANLAQVKVRYSEGGTKCHLFCHHRVNLFKLAESTGSQIAFENLNFRADINAVCNCFREVAIAENVLDK